MLTVLKLLEILGSFTGPFNTTTLSDTIGISLSENLKVSAIRLIKGQPGKFVQDPCGHLHLCTFPEPLTSG